MGATGGGGGKCDKAFELVLVLVFWAGGEEWASFVGDMIWAGQRVGDDDERVDKRPVMIEVRREGRGSVCRWRWRIKGSVAVEHVRGGENEGGQRY